MQYDYERFTPDRFQEFCQSLLVREFAGVQCFPVGQKDGGRDATAGPTSDSIVFQVKFRRDRLKGEDSYKLMKAAIDGEISKVRVLASKGATRYVLMTNINGSAALDSGAMDKVQKYMEEVLPIPAAVWWRSDLDARLNNAYDLKWIFSEVLTSADAFRLLIEEGLGEHARRRQLAISGYLTSQYDGDEYVKFRQADLQASDLLSLFVDVPVSPMVSPRQHKARMQHVSRVFNAVIEEEGAAPAENRRGRPTIGGATLLANPTAQRHLTRVILEGAPGQGKSTLAQYLCQIHRMRILDKQQRLARLQPSHRLVPVKLPFKIDLRDFASWLRRVDPITEAPLPNDLSPSLETFMAAQVRHGSGGQSFEASDIHLLLERTPALILLDGLDEVAESADRRAVIEGVSAAAARLETLSPLTQIIVTSRPAAVPNAPVFDHRTWDYLHLEDITEDLIFDYTDRWCTARKIEAKEVEDIKAILRSKLSSPHVKDLARNAMQLTILLNLVQARGQALPDQRTALYDQYVDVFFNREAEKNRVVLDHRQLLIDLHGYLAWRMHAAAESKRSNGRVSAETLRDLVSEYLDRQEHDKAILDDLLMGVAQRIVALVSRVEGTYEFEVQPLREYFAARHLYNTAPYSPAGRVERGTKPEIFHAISANPYWHNATRFFAGCYSVGELSGLADQVDELFVDPAGGKTSFVRAVATSLLADRVFHQAPKVSRRVVERSIDPLTLRYAFVRQFSASNALQLNLSSSGGIQDALALTFDLSIRSDIPAARHEFRHLAAWLGPDELRQEVWLGMRPDGADTEGIARWLEAGMQARVLYALPPAAARAFAASNNRYDQMLRRIGHPGLSRDEVKEGELLTTALNGSDYVDTWSASPSSALFFAFRYEQLLHRDRGPLFYASDEHALKQAPGPIKAVGARLLRTVHTRRAEFPTEVGAWEELLGVLEEARDRPWLSWRLCVTAASAGVEREMSDDDCSAIGFDCLSAFSLVGAARAQRSRPVWWQDLASRAATPLERRAWLLMYACFANPVSLEAALHIADEFLRGLSSSDMAALLEAAHRATGATIPESRWEDMLASNPSARFRVLLGSRVRGAARGEIVSSLSDAELDDWSLANVCLSWLVSMNRLPQSDGEWRSFVAESRRIYARSADAFAGAWPIDTSRSTRDQMPDSIAESVLDDCLKFPASIIALADRSKSASRQSSKISIGRIARKDRWNAG